MEQSEILQIDSKTRQAAVREYLRYDDLETSYIDEATTYEDNDEPIPFAVESNIDWYAAMKEGIWAICNVIGIDLQKELEIYYEQAKEQANGQVQESAGENM